MKNTTNDPNWLASWPASWPAGQPAGRPASRPASRPGGRQASQPASRPAGRSVGRPAGRTGGRAGGRAGWWAKTLRGLPFSMDRMRVGRESDFSGANDSAPAEDVDNENPSFVALGKMLKSGRQAKAKMGAAAFDFWFSICQKPKQHWSFYGPRFCGDPFLSTVWILFDSFLGMSFGKGQNHSRTIFQPFLLLGPLRGHRPYNCHPSDNSRPAGTWRP